jgi:quercetin dioxygenase-like cupin family protein
MQYVRRFDSGALDRGRFDYQVLADLETCLVVACRAPAGQPGPARHVHGSDQVYYVLDGEMKLELGGATHVAGRDSLVFISAGTPHHNWNAGDAPELHLDILVPPPARGKALSRPAVDTDQAPGTAYVRQLADEPYQHTHVPGFDMARMASPETGSTHITVNSASLSPESPGTSWHIHPFDQLYFVLEGVLTIDVANEHHEVPPGHLVVLPAGVPHRNRNDGDVTERHVAILAPAPTGRPLDLDVTWKVG